MTSWPTLRKQTLEHDSYTCQECGATLGMLHAHHKLPRWQGGKDELENLITLCQPCHLAFHANEDRQHANELDRIGKAQYEAMKQCEKDFITLTGCYPQIDDRFSEFSRDWPGWTNVPRYT